MSSIKSEMAEISSEVVTTPHIITIHMTVRPTYVTYQRGSQLRLSIFNGLLIMFSRHVLRLGWAASCASAYCRGLLDIINNIIMLSSRVTRGAQSIARGAAQ